MYVKALHEKYPDNMIICCEIYPEFEKTQLENINFKELILKNVYLIMGKNKLQAYQDYLSMMLNYSDYEQAKFCAIPNYSKIDRNVFSIYKTLFLNRMEKLVVTRNTLIQDEKLRRDSFLHNLFIFPREYTLGQLFDKVQKYDFSDRAAIVVSAGPSLDNNIRLLKKAKGKACLISVDSAAKAMIKAGVVPDLIITVDPGKNEEILQTEELLNCVLVSSIYAHYKINKQHRGIIYFPTSESEYSELIYSKYNKEMYHLESGGSVANNAFSLAEEMGFGTIILVGQDLAYPEGKVHASGAIYKDCPDNKIDENIDTKYFKVEANNGGTLLTEANMEMYRKWFEERILQQNVRVINATEGGAKIKGAEVMTLKEALEEPCCMKEELDFESLMKVKKQAFSEEQQKEIFLNYLGLEDRITEWEKRLQVGIQKYERLAELNRKGKYSTSEYKNLVKEIGDLTRNFNASEEVHLLNQWGNKEEYEVLDSIAKSQKSQYEETKLIIDGGIKMYKTYIDNCKLLKGYWNELLIEYGLKNKN